MKITQKILQNIIKEEVQKILNEKTTQANAHMHQMAQQNNPALNAPEVKAITPLLKAIDGVDEVLVDGIRNSKKTGFKLITLDIRVRQHQA